MDNPLLRQHRMLWVLCLVAYAALMPSKALADDTQASAPAAADSTDCSPLPRLRLAGTTMSDGRAPAQAVIEDVDSGQQHLLSLSDALGSFRLSAISREGVVLTAYRCTGGEVVLALTEGQAPKKHDDLSQTIDFDPADSTHVVRVRPGSLVERLGVRPGDTLATVNGREVADAATAKSKLSALGESDVDSIGVKRDGRLSVFVNPASTTVLNFKPPPPVKAEEGAQASPTVIHGMAIP